VQVADETGDLGSRLLFEQILITEECPMAWLELQLALIGRIAQAACIANRMPVSWDKLQSPS
jgi:bacterioferritin (cytochrome b1)